MSSGGAIRNEKRDHPAGASPCNADPATWSFGAGAVSMGPLTSVSLAPL